jgi:hypothetical protein
LIIWSRFVAVVLSDERVEDAGQAEGDRMETGSEMDMSGSEEVGVVLERIRSSRTGVY